jgi:DNA-binding transcriptional LysR family regulator
MRRRPFIAGLATVWLGAATENAGGRAPQRMALRQCKVVLTDYFRAAHRLEYHSALESANEFRGRPAGLLRLTAPPPAADFFLGSAIPRFLAEYPEISLDLSFNEALTDIVAERFDAGIRIGERIERDMIAVRVTDEPPVVVAGSPAYFAQRGKPKSPKDLVAHDCIRTRFASGTYLPWRFRVRAGGSRSCVAAHAGSPPS